MTPDALDRFIREAATALDLDPFSVARTEEGLSDLLARLAAERDGALYEASAAKGRVADLASERDIAEECNAVRAMLLTKNAAYGNSALDPVRIFSKASPVEQILVRLDDKLSRLARGSAAGEDVVLDLIGYLILLRIAERREREEIIRARPESEVRLASCEAWQISAKRCNYCDEALARRPRACAIDKETRP